MLLIKKNLVELDSLDLLSFHEIIVKKQRKVIGFQNFCPFK